MSHSLIIGRQFELLSGGQFIQSGPAAGAVVRLGDFGGNSSFDLGAGEPQTTFISSLLLDGERSVGRRTGNAQVTLPIYVRAPGINTLFAARELVLGIVDQEIWEMVLTLDGMQSTVFDCLRAKTSLPFRLREVDQDVLTFNVTCQRLPFGRSDQTQSMSIQAPPGTPGGGAISYLPTLRVDGLESYTGTTLISGAAWSITQDERFGSSGLQALRTTGASIMQRTVTQVNLTSYTGLRFWLAVSGKAATRTITFTLYDTTDKAWVLPSFTRALAGNLKYVWNIISLRNTSPPVGFNTGAINRYQFQTNGSIYLDDVDAVDSVINVYGGTRGAVYEIHDVQGSARVPINIDLDRPSGASITGGLVHHPKEVPNDYMPIVQLNPATPIDGRTVSLPIGSSTSPWQGTYAVCFAIAALVGGASTLRTTSVTITQSGGGYTDSVTVSRTYSPNEIGTAKYLFIDKVSLPVRAYGPDVLGATWTISINCTLGGGSFDSFTDLLFIDTAGDTVLWQNAAAAAHVYIDEPDPVIVNHGRIVAGSSHQTAASLSDKIGVLSGQPFGLDPGENCLLVHVVDGAARLTVDYVPRWHGLRSY